MPLYKDVRVLKRMGYLANFIDANSKIGDIYQLEDKRWVYVTNIAKLDPNIDLAGNTEKGPTRTLMSYVWETGSEATLGALVTTDDILDAEFQVTFKEENSLFASFKNAHTETLDLEAIADKVEKQWKKKKYHLHPFKFFMVNQIVKAESGVMVYSESANHSVKLSGKGNIPVNGLEITASGNFAIQQANSKVLDIIYDQPHIPLFQAVRRKIGGLWEAMGE